MRKLITILILVMAVMAAVVAPLAELYLPKRPQAIDRLVFFPSKYPLGNWTPTDIHFEDIYFAAEDGTRLHGWFLPCESPIATVLIAHGNAGNLTSRTKLLRHLQATNLSVFIFDYRGYGRSEGRPTIEGVVQDANAARGKLRELASINDNEMLLMGESLGGAIVVQLAAESAPRGLILQSTFSSLKDLAMVHYPQHAAMVPRRTFDSVTQMANFEGPLFQSHGEHDQTIPIELGRKLYAAAHDPKDFVTIAGADHNDWLTDEYLEQLDAFIDGQLANDGRRGGQDAILGQED